MCEDGAQKSIFLGDDGVDGSIPGRRCVRGSAVRYLTCALGVSLLMKLAVELSLADFVDVGAVCNANEDVVFGGNPIESGRVLEVTS